MTHLAAGARLTLPVEMQLRLGIGEDLAPTQHLIAQKIRHHRIGMMFDGPQRQSADRAHELLELAGDAGIDGPMAGVMRPRRQLVHQHLA